MYKVKFEKYYNDYRNSQEVETYGSLEAIADWLFGMVKGDYKKSSLFFTNPDREHVWNGKLSLDSSCIKSYDGHYSYHVEQIEKDGVIIYSCGTFTNGICHWDEEVKEWLRRCRRRIENPVFNFSSATTKLYWASYLVKDMTTNKVASVSTYNGCLTEDEAKKVIDKARQNFTVLSAWIDTFDSSNKKTTVFHECYVDAVGNVEK